MTGPLTRQTSEGSHTSEVFIVTDSPSLSHVPRFLILNCLTNRPIHHISRFPGGICAVTRDSKLLGCDVYYLKNSMKMMVLLRGLDLCLI